MSAVESLKLVVVGDGAVGKSALLITHTTNSFPSEYVPTVFDNYSANKFVDGKNYCIGLWDTAGQEDYDRLRPLSYPETDILLVCFDINNKNSFENIRHKWMPEIDHYCPGIPRILVGCKKDLRTEARAESQVTRAEAKKLALELKLQQYMETSSLEYVGLEELFDVAVKLAVLGKQNKKSRKKSIFNIKRRKTANGPMEVVLPPVMPPAGFAPEVEIETCTKGDQWLALLKDDSCADTILILSTGQEVVAHKAMLASSSADFRKAFGLDTKKVKYRKQTTPSSAHLPGIKKVEMEVGCNLTRVYLTDSVEAEVLEYALEFLYAGVLVFERTPSGELLDGLREFSELFTLPYLKQICDNIENEEEELNPSIGTYLCDQMGQQMRDLFLNKQTFADVKFIFPEQEVFAHKCLLSCRNKIMAVMFDGRFQEGKSQSITTIDMRKDRDEDVATFLTLLEYLYTGHTPLDQGVDPVSLLILSDRYNVTRLINLIELHITKVVDRKCFKNIEKADIDVIGLLNVSRTYNAKQLTKWCLHFISTNYIAFVPRLEWNQLSSDDMEHIEEHRWPPVDYLNEVREYEALVAEAKGASGAGCAVM